MKGSIAVTTTIGVLDDIVGAIFTFGDVAFLMMAIYGAGQRSATLLRRAYVWMTLHALVQCAMLLVRRATSEADLRSRTASSFYYRAVSEYTCWGWSVDVPDDPEPDWDFDADGSCFFACISECGLAVL